MYHDRLLPVSQLGDVNDTMVDNQRLTLRGLFYSGEKAEQAAEAPAGHAIARPAGRRLGLT